MTPFPFCLHFFVRISVHSVSAHCCVWTFLSGNMDLLLWKKCIWRLSENFLLSLTKTICTYHRFDEHMIHILVVASMCMIQKCVGHHKQFPDVSNQFLQNLKRNLNIIQYSVIQYLKLLQYVCIHIISMRICF